MRLFQTVWNMENGKPDLEMMDFNMHSFHLEIKSEWRLEQRLLAALLGKYGYVANQAQNERYINIMKYAFTTIPGILWIVTAVVLFFYRLNKKRYNEIVEDLKNGRKRLILLR